MMLVEERPRSSSAVQRDERERGAPVASNDDDAHQKIDELERLALTLISEAKELLETAARLRNLISLGDERSLEGHADGRFPR